MDFVTVYIREAHASDEWPLGTAICIAQHKTIEDRLQAARDFVRQFEWTVPCAVDTMDNTFNQGTKKSE